MQMKDLRTYNTRIYYMYFSTLTSPQNPIKVTLRHTLLALTIVLFNSDRTTKFKRKASRHTIRTFTIVFNSDVTTNLKNVTLQHTERTCIYDSCF